MKISIIPVQQGSEGSSRLSIMPQWCWHSQSSQTSSETKSPPFTTRGTTATPFTDNCNKNICQYTVCPFGDGLRTRSVTIESQRMSVVRVNQADNITSRRRTSHRLSVYYIAIESRRKKAVYYYCCVSSCERDGGPITSYPS